MYLMILKIVLCNFLKDQNKIEYNPSDFKTLQITIKANLKYSILICSVNSTELKDTESNPDEKYNIE